MKMRHFDLNLTEGQTIVADEIMKEIVKDAREKLLLLLKDEETDDRAMKRVVKKIEVAEMILHTIS